MWLQAFILTQILEMPIYIVALRERPWWHRPIIAFGASALTHPLVWHFTMTLTLSYRFDFWIVVAVAELFAVLGEALYLRLLGLGHALLWSLGANGFSFGMGLLLYELELM